MINRTTIAREAIGAAFTIICAVLCYLAGAFVFASFNIADWPFTGRFIVGLVGGWFSLLPYMLYTGKMS